VRLTRTKIHSIAADSTLVIPACSWRESSDFDLHPSSFPRKQCEGMDAEANIRAANGPKILPAKRF
jgi:hypothetical protein